MSPSSSASSDWPRRISPPDRPNLICLTEALGLPAALTGTRAAIARRARTSQAALTLLALAHQREMAAARRRWPGISLARALLLARADALYRPFARTLSRLARQYRAHIVATTFAPRLAEPLPLAEGAPGRVEPAGPEVYNAALVFGPDGALLGRVDKVYLTHGEIESLDLSPAPLEDVTVIATEAGRLGVAISLDAFTPAYLRRLNDLGARSSSSRTPTTSRGPRPPRSAHGSRASGWTPPSARSSQPIPIWRTISAPCRPARCSISCSTASRALPRATRLRPAGRADATSAWTSGATAGRASGFAAASWRWRRGSRPIPVEAEPWLTLAQRRARLATIARGLRPEDYRESVIWADLAIED